MRRDYDPLLFDPPARVVRLVVPPVVLLRRPRPVVVLLPVPRLVLVPLRRSVLRPCPVLPSRPPTRWARSPVLLHALKETFRLSRLC